MKENTQEKSLVQVNRNEIFNKINKKFLEKTNKLQKYLEKNR